MKKYTKEEQQRALKKLATAYGRWNVAGDGDDRQKRNVALYSATWKVIAKFGLQETARAAYQKRRAE
jgi:hypothetical protein